MTEKRDEIAAVACALIQRDGYFGFTYKELGQLAKVPAGTLYRSFRTKDELLIYIFSRSIKHLLEAITLIDSSALSPREKLACIHSYPFYLRHINADRLGIDLVGANRAILEHCSPEVQDELKGLLRAMLQRQREVLTRMHEQGDLLAETETVNQLEKRLLLLQRGAVVFASHPFVPADDYGLLDVIRLIDFNLGAVAWSDHDGGIEPRNVAVALRTVADKLNLSFSHDQH